MSGAGPAGVPIRWRLTLGVALAALVALTVIDVSVYRHTEAHLVSVLDDGLREEAGEMVPLLTGGGEIADLTPLVHEDDVGSLLLLQAFDGEGRLVGASSSARGRALVPAGPASASGLPRFARVAGVGRVRLLALEATIEGAPHTLAAAVSYRATAASLAGLQRRLAAWTLVALAVTAALAYGLALAALRPVERMRRQAAEIRWSEPGRRLPLPPADDEIRRLGETLNHTLDDLEEASTRRRLVVAHASHELRTPLTRLRTTLELAGRGDRTVDELRTAVEEAAADTEELIALTDGLLDLGALESGPARTAPTAIDLARTARAVADAAPGVTVSVTGTSWVSGDPLLLHRALSNLVDNARLHGRPPVAVAVEGGEEEVTIVVWDHGPGMSDELATVAFEPFTRASDAVRRPGSGLGLALVAAIALRHGGEWALTRDGGRFGVRLVLPAAAPTVAPAAPPVGRDRAGVTVPVSS